MIPHMVGLIPLLKVFLHVQTLNEFIQRRIRLSTQLPALGNRIFHVCIEPIQLCA